MTKTSFFQSVSQEKGEGNKKGCERLSKSKFTPFGIKVKTNLLRNGKDLTWLADEVRSDTDMYIDSGYMNKILTGKRHPQKIIDSICRILKIAGE